MEAKEVFLALLVPVSPAAQAQVTAERSLATLVVEGLALGELNRGPPQLILLKAQGEALVFLVAMEAKDPKAALVPIVHLAMEETLAL
jgi:hypothetical protein